MQSDEAETTESKAIANRIRELLEQHGIGQRQQTSAVQRILGLSYSQVHRKMRGANPWTISQIKAVAEAFGESPGNLVENAPDRSLRHPDGHAQDAWLTIDSRCYPCRAVIGDEIFDHGTAEFVAINVVGHWRIYTERQAPRGERYSVASIEIKPKLTVPYKPLVAVVDDEISVAQSIGDFLNRNGFISVAYNSEESLGNALGKVAFDAFIIDWLLGEKTAEHLLKNIRTSGNVDVPVFLLTGKIITGEVDELDMASVIRRFDVHSLEKPIRLPLLTAELSRRISARM